MLTRVSRRFAFAVLGGLVTVPAGCGGDPTLHAFFGDTGAELRVAGPVGDSDTSANVSGPGPDAAVVAAPDNDIVDPRVAAVTAFAQAVGEDPAQAALDALLSALRTGEASGSVGTLPPSATVRHPLAQLRAVTRDLRRAARAKLRAALEPEQIAGVLLDEMIANAPEGTSPEILALLREILRQAASAAPTSQPADAAAAASTFEQALARWLVTDLLRGTPASP